LTQIKELSSWLPLSHPGKAARARNMTGDAAPSVPFWQLPQAELERQLGGAGAKGLSTSEAEERLLRHGRNAFGATGWPARWRRDSAIPWC
jgi:hypothetical protein